MPTRQVLVFLGIFSGTNCRQHELAISRERPNKWRRKMNGRWVGGVLCFRRQTQDAGYDISGALEMVSGMDQCLNREFEVSMEESYPDPRLGNYFHAERGEDRRAAHAGQAERGDPLARFAGGQDQTGRPRGENQTATSAPQERGRSKGSCLREATAGSRPAAAHA